MLAVTAVIKDYQKASTSVMAFEVFFDVTITIGTDTLGNVRPGGLQDAHRMLDACEYLGVQISREMSSGVALQD